jgi:hypothetical protein
MKKTNRKYKRARYDICFRVRIKRCRYLKEENIFRNNILVAQIIYWLEKNRFEIGDNLFIFGLKIPI